MKKTLVVLLLALSIVGLKAQEAKPDVLDLVYDLQKWKKDGKQMKLVWWIPTVYWQIALEQSPGVSQSQIDDIVAAVEQYTFIAAIDGRIGPYGLNYEDNIALNIIDNKGEKINPLSVDAMSSQTKTVLSVLKPVLSNTIGQMGQNMQFFVFDCCDAEGKLLGNPTEEGLFKVVNNGDLFEWRLPLGSLTPKKTCPVDGEKLNGSWVYCPWHGEKLVKN